MGSCGVGAGATAAGAVACGGSAFATRLAPGCWACAVAINAKLAAKPTIAPRADEPQRNIRFLHIQLAAR